MTSHPWKTAFVAIGVIVGVVCAGDIGLRAYMAYMYPYGPRHCCLKQISLSLLNYADENNGVFPAGQACPEASLSLLAKIKYGPGDEVLCGKTIPAEVSKRALAQTGVLGPDSCDGHYVEGFTNKDDYRLAVVWDKVGLGHNGERLAPGSHEVAFVDGSTRIVSGSDWPQFLAEQQKLLRSRDKINRTP